MSKLIEKSIMIAYKNTEYSRAILVRCSYQTRPFEDWLLRKRIPYIVVGGLKFYERKEIKDLLCYFRFLYNKSDKVSE